MTHAQATLWDGMIRTPRCSCKQCKNSKGNWRQVGQVRVQYTILHQEWTYHRAEDDILSHTVTVLYLIPFGMKLLMTKTYSSNVCKANFDTLPKIVRESMELQKSSYNKNLMEIRCTTSGNQGYGNRRM